MNKLTTIALLSAALTFASCKKEQPSISLVDFQGVELEPNSHWNGSDGSGEKKFGIVSFANSFTDFGGGFVYWEGFAFSNETNISIPGYESQYSAMISQGLEASNIYAVAYCSDDAATISFDIPIKPVGVEVANSTYTYFSMLQGDEFSKKFGGDSGLDSDWLLLSIVGYRGSEKTGTVEFYLADYRFEESTKDYIVDRWSQVKLDDLGRVDRLVLKLSSSDTGEWGMNTPAYFVFDNLKFTQD